MDGLRAVPKRGLRRWRKSAVAGQSRDTDSRAGLIVVLPAPLAGFALGLLLGNDGLNLG